MNGARFRYEPNPSHKIQTTEAGPPRWRPDKSACPEDITFKKINELIGNSCSESDDPEEPVRYAVWRRKGGMMWFRSLLTRKLPDGTIIIHGHPFSPGYPKVPPKVLRKLRDNGCITKSEYMQLVKT